MIKRKFILILISAVLFTACKSDLRKEQAKYEASLDSYQVLAYRGAKMMVRASSTIDTKQDTYAEVFKIDKDSIGTALEFQKFVDQLMKAAQDTNALKQIELDWPKLAKEVYVLSDKIKETDEDKYPMFIELAPDTLSTPLKQYFTQNNLRYNNSIEHLFFGLLGTASFSSPKEINLYELSRVKREEIGDNELWILKEFLEILNMSLNEWHHLAEHRCSELIKTNERQPCSAMLISKNSGGKISTEGWKKALQAMCYGLRAYERFKLSKEDEDKKKEALDDIIVAVELSNEAGLNIPEINLLAGSIAAVNKDFDKTKFYFQKVVDHPDAKPESKEYAQRIISMIDSGDEDEVADEIDENMKEKMIIFEAVKDFAGLSLDMEEYGGKMLEESKGKPVEQCFAFLKIYTMQTKDWDLYLQISKVEMKWKELTN